MDNRKTTLVNVIAIIGALLIVGISIAQICFGTDKYVMTILYRLMAFLFLTLIIGIIIAIVLRYGKYGVHTKDRKEEFIGIAKSIGFVYKDRLPTVFIQSLEPLFMQFRLALLWRFDRYGYNVIEGSRKDINWTIFDYSFKIYANYIKAVPHFKTVFYAETTNLQFPYFRTDCKGKNAVNLGILDRPVSRDFIDFNNYPVFSKRFYVYGKDKAAVKTLFSPSLVAFLEKMEKDISIEAMGSKIIFSMPILAVDDLPSILEKAEQIIGFLKESLPNVKQRANVSSSMPRYCPNCGKSYDDSWRICIHCNKQLIENPNFQGKGAT